MIQGRMIWKQPIFAISGACVTIIVESTGTLQITEKLSEANNKRFIHFQLVLNPYDAKRYETASAPTNTDEKRSTVMAVLLALYTTRAASN